MAPLKLLSDNCNLVREVRLEMQDDMEPIRPSDMRSTAVTRLGDCAVQVTPCQLQNCLDVLLHDDKALAGSESWDLKQRRACRSFSATELRAAVEEDLNKATDPAVASASYLIPLQKCIFRFLCKALISADPAVDGLVDWFDLYILDVWLALQLVTTQKLDLMSPPELILLWPLPSLQVLIRPLARVPRRMSRGCSARTTSK
uniref:Uncharacterized protein n=1 Tax=Oryza nivara TaxID=4536 RepID=A0A0E0HSM3_ORYNI